MKKKIDVGPGYRRLGNFEVTKPGDEYLSGKSWYQTEDESKPVYQHGQGMVYRRRLPDPILQVVGRLKEDLNVEEVSTCVDSTDLATIIAWVEERAK